MEISHSHGNVATFDLPNAYFRHTKPTYTSQRLFPLHTSQASSCSSIFRFHIPCSSAKKGSIFTPIERPPNAFRTPIERLLHAFERLRLRLITLKMLPKTHLGTPEYDRGTVGRARYGVLRLSTPKYADLTAAWKSYHGLEMFHHSDSRSLFPHYTRPRNIYMIYVCIYYDELLRDMI